MRGQTRSGRRLTPRAPMLRWPDSVAACDAPIPYNSRRFGPTLTAASVAIAAQKDQHLRSLSAWETDRNEMNRMVPPASKKRVDDIEEVCGAHA